MVNKFKENTTVLQNEAIGLGIYSMWIKVENVAKYAKPGQFIDVYIKDSGRLLPRPISLCEVDSNNNKIRIVYRVTGKSTGTEILSQVKKGESITIVGPLGNGFPLKDKRAILIGGGIGIPPMLELAKQLKCEKKIVLGYRDEVFLMSEMEKNGEVYPASDDGSIGTKGNVIDAIIENKIDGDVIYACGPTPMLRAIKEYAANNKIECYISLEEKMACGIGACLACVCKTKDVNPDTNINNARICKDGPVFLSTEVEI